MFTAKNLAPKVITDNSFVSPLPPQTDSNGSEVTDNSYTKNTQKSIGNCNKCHNTGWYEEVERRGMFYIEIQCDCNPQAIPREEFMLGGDG